MYNFIISPFSVMWWECFLSTITVMVLSFILFKKLSLFYQKKVCKFLGFFLFFDLIFHQFLIRDAGLWDFRTSLPLHFCNIMEIFAAIALIWYQRWFFEVCYLLGIIAPFQAILTPAFALAPEGYYFFAFFLGHAAVIMAPLFLAFGIGIPLRRGAFWKIPCTFFPIAFFIYLFDWLFDANYMYLCQNPPVSHPLNSYSWPFYIFIWMGLFFLSSAILSLFTYVMQKKQIKNQIF